MFHTSSRRAGWLPMPKAPSWKVDDWGTSPHPRLWSHNQGEGHGRYWYLFCGSNFSLLLMRHIFSQIKHSFNPETSFFFHFANPKLVNLGPIYVIAIIALRLSSSLNLKQFIHSAYPLHRRVQVLYHPAQGVCTLSYCPWGQYPWQAQSSLALCQVLSKHPKKNTKTASSALALFCLQQRCASHLMASN